MVGLGDLHRSFRILTILQSYATMSLPKQRGNFQKDIIQQVNLEFPTKRYRNMLKTHIMLYHTHHWGKLSPLLSCSESIESVHEHFPAYARLTSQVLERKRLTWDNTIWFPWAAILPPGLWGPQDLNSWSFPFLFWCFIIAERQQIAYIPFFSDSFWSVNEHVCMLKW